MPAIAMTSPFLRLGQQQVFRPRRLQPLGERLGRFLAIEQADVNADDPRERHVEMVLPGRREPQAFPGRCLELAEELFLARQIEPGIGPWHSRLGLGSTASLGSVCSSALAVALPACPSSYMTLIVKFF